MKPFTSRYLLLAAFSLLLGACQSTPPAAVQAPATPSEVISIAAGLRLKAIGDAATGAQNPRRKYPIEHTHLAAAA